MSKLLFQAALLCLLGGCVTSTEGLKLYRGKPEEPFAQKPSTGQFVEVTYLGVGGFLVRRGIDSILFAPSFTNPNPLELAFTRIAPDADRIDACLQGVPVQTVGWVIAGHSHYDHLLDVPYILRKHTLLANFIGPKTAGHIVAAEVPRDRIIREISEGVATGGKSGKWYYNTRRTLRVMALESEHSPHIYGLKLLAEGHYDQDLPALPQSGMCGWKEGETYAYLVDFLDPENGRVAFRIHYQDAASTPEYGFIPEEVRKEESRVDLAILNVGASEQIKDKRYPGEILEKMSPRYVILGHWEDFLLGPSCRKEQPVLLTLGAGGLEEFIHRVEECVPEARWILPHPPSRMYLPDPKGPPPVVPPGRCTHSRKTSASTQPGP